MPATEQAVGTEAGFDRRGQQVSGTVQTWSYMDGRKVGESVTMHQVLAASGPAEGSPYHGATWSTAPIDLALVGA